MRQKCNVCFRHENSENMQAKEKIILQAGRHNGEIVTVFLNDFGVIELDVALEGLKDMALPFNVSVKDRDAMAMLKEISPSDIENINDLVGRQCTFDVAVTVLVSGGEHRAVNEIESIGYDDNF